MDMGKFRFWYNHSKCRKQYYYASKNYFLCIYLGDYTKIKSDPIYVDFPINTYNKMYVTLINGTVPIFKNKDNEITKYLEKEGIIGDEYDGFYVNYDHLEKIYNFIEADNIYVQPSPRAWEKSSDYLNEGYGKIDEDYNFIDYSIGESKREEKACKHCGKDNDVGVCSCWWCGTSKPTE